MSFLLSPQAAESDMREREREMHAVMGSGLLTQEIINFFKVIGISVWEMRLNCFLTISSELKSDGIFWQNSCTVLCAIYHLPSVMPFGHISRQV